MLYVIYQNRFIYCENVCELIDSMKSLGILQICKLLSVPST